MLSANFVPPQQLSQNITHEGITLDMPKSPEHGDNNNIKSQLLPNGQFAVGGSLGLIMRVDELLSRDGDDLSVFILSQ